MKNVLILTYWSFKDALVQTYTLPYVEIIRKKTNPDTKIFLLTLEQEFHKMTEIEWLTEKEKYKKQNIILLRFKYDHFGFIMLIRILKLLFSLTRLIYKQNISTIHSWCMSAGSLGYLLSQITSKRLIIDSYEPHAEAMAENGTWNKSSFKFKLLFWLEKKQSKRAKTVIALTKGMATYAKDKYNATFDNYYVKPSLVNLEKFKWIEEDYTSFRKNKNLENKVVCVYAGKLGGIYLEEEVFDFFKTASDYWEGKLKIFLLTDKDEDEVNTFILQKNIPIDCIETEFVPHHEIQQYYQLADFAINPVKSVPSKQYCTSIKDGEYWAMGLPVVITKNISDDSSIIEKENVGYVLKELNSKEYNNACEKIDELISTNKIELNNRIRLVAKKYRSFDIAESIYGEIYS
jgi:glycosyltransferase involved in cell wall biosynthesis